MIVIMSFCLITFYVTGEIFKINDSESVSTREMRAILVDKGGIIQ